MNIEESLKIIKYMCKCQDGNCSYTCPIGDVCMFKDVPSSWDDDEIKADCEHIEKWYNQNKDLTILEVVKMNFPKIKIGEDGLPAVCPHTLFGEEFHPSYCIDYHLNYTDDEERETCKRCWNTMAPKEYQRKGKR